MSIAEKLTQIAENEQKVFDAGYEKGKAEGGGQDTYYNEFWDEYQQKGDRFNYYSLFVQSGWNDITFKPKYPIICYAVETYHNSNASQIFYNSRMTKIDVPITITGITLSQTFYNATKLKTISLLKLVDVPSFANAFTYCNELENITIGGSIDANIDFSACWKLTKESIQSIVDHLKDLTGQPSQTLGLHSDTLAKLTEEQMLTISSKNWTF